MADPSSTLCCARCAPRPVVACCNICDPGHFVFPVKEPTNKPPKAPRKHMPKSDQGTAEKSLCKALISLRQDLAKDEALMLTAKAFMSDTILDRIVDLAHYQLIKTAAALHKQITWGYLDTCASRILELINQHCPPPVASSLFTTAPLQRPSYTSNSANTPTGASTHTAAKRKRMLCGVPGHYRKLCYMIELTYH